MMIPSPTFTAPNNRSEGKLNRCQNNTSFAVKGNSISFMPTIEPFTPTQDVCQSKEHVQYT